VYRCGTALTAPSTLATELADFAEAFAAARDLERPCERRCTLQPVGFHLAVRAGQFELARERLAIVRATAEKLGQPLLPVGRQLLRRLTRFATRRHRRGRSSSPPPRSRWVRQAESPTPLRSTACSSCKPGTSRAGWESSSRSSPTLPSRIHRYPPSGQLLAAAHLDAGDEAAARELVDEAAADSFSLPEDSGWFDGIICYARVVIELQLRVHGERLIELLVPFRDQVPHNGVVPQPPVATYLGGLATVAGRYEEAESYFEQAAELNTRGEMRFAEAEHEHTLWGRMLRARNGPGDADRARELLEQARESAAARGYAMVERRANTELSKLS
jgi:tetratricopeptide (TPR) repeat protein